MNDDDKDDDDKDVWEEDEFWTKHAVSLAEQIEQLSLGAKESSSTEDEQTLAATIGAAPRRNSEPQPSRKQSQEKHDSTNATYSSCIPQSSEASAHLLPIPDKTRKVELNVVTCKLKHDIPEESTCQPIEDNKENRHPTHPSVPSSEKLPQVTSDITKYITSSYQNSRAKQAISSDEIDQICQAVESTTIASKSSVLLVSPTEKQVPYEFIQQWMNTMERDVDFDLPSLYQKLEPSQDKCISFAATFDEKKSTSLSWKNSPGKALALGLHLHIPNLTKSNRCFRKYGSHRFLRLQFTSWKPGDAKQNLLKKLVASQETLDVAGRSYRFLHARPNNDDNIGGLTCFFFAEKSFDPCLPLDYIKVEDIRKWHIPSHENVDMTMATYNARFDLAFSKTLPVGFVKSATLRGVCTPIPDVYSDSYQMMTDGCAPITPQILLQLKSCIPNLTSTPSAIQARLGPYKGVWYFHPDEIGIALRPSMKKYNLTSDCVHQRTLEVVKYSRFHGRSCLNRQIILLLECLMPSPFDTLLELQSEYLDELKDCMTSPKKARTFLSCFPTEPECTKALRMIDAGLWPEHHLMQTLAKVRDKKIRLVCEKSHIKVTKSTRLLMIADPTGALKEDEVFVHVSDPSVGVVLGPLLVTRNPCYHPGDIRKLTAVSLPAKWFACLVDVIVLSVKGDRSSANMMSGGDFDGDEAWICWDRRLVDAVTPVNPSCYPEGAKVNSNEDAHQPFACLGLKSPSSIAVLREAYRVMHIQKNLGTLSNWHLLRADWSDQGVLDYGCLHMSHVLSVLMDAHKSGHSIQLPDEYHERSYPDWWDSKLNRKMKHRRSQSCVGLLYKAAHAYMSLHSHSLDRWKRENTPWQPHPQLWKRCKELSISPQHVLPQIQKYEALFVRSMQLHGQDRACVLDCARQVSITSSTSNQSIHERDALEAYLACFEDYRAKRIDLSKDEGLVRLSSYAWEKYFDILCQVARDGRGL